MNILLQNSTAQLPQKTAKQEKVMYLPESTPYDWELYKMVSHTSKEDQDHYHTHITKRYIRQMFLYTPIAFWKAFTSRKYNRILDEEIGKFYWECAFGRSLRPITDLELHEWNEYLSLDDEEILIASYDAMKDVKTYDGMYTAATQGVFIKKEKTLTIKGIKVADEYFFPSDGMLWEVAKCYLLYGTTYQLLMVDHPKVHLPLETLIGHSMRLLPKGHIVRQLLLPHFDFTLEVNASVMHSPDSLLNGKSHLPYTGLFGGKENFLRFFSIGYTGVKEWASYIPYQFRLEIESVPTDYQLYLQAYYDVIVTFVEKVFSQSNYKPENDEIISLWAEAIGKDLPGFEEAFSIDQLAQVVGKIIFSASVEHTVDHGPFAAISVDKLPLRLRTPPPSRKNKSKIRYRDIRWRLDCFKHLMARKMFFAPHHVTLLKDVDYGFQDSTLKQLNQQFREELLKTDQRLREQGIFIYQDVHEISCSLQY